MGDRTAAAGVEAGRTSGALTGSGLAGCFFAAARSSCIVRISSFAERGGRGAGAGAGVGVGAAFGAGLGSGDERGTTLGEGEGASGSEDGLAAGTGALTGTVGLTGTEGLTGTGGLTGMGALMGTEAVTEEAWLPDPLRLVAGDRLRAEDSLLKGDFARLGGVGLITGGTGGVGRGVTGLGGTGCIIQL